MAAYVISSAVTTNLVLGIGDSIQVTSQGSVTTGGFLAAIYGFGRDSLLIEGALTHSSFNGIRLEGSGSNTLINFGVVNAPGGAVAISGNANTVFNGGRLLGGPTALAFSGSGNNVVNTGIIQADNDGAGIAVSGGSTAIVNYGAISGHDGISINGGAGTTNLVINNGDIQGTGRGFDDFNVFGIRTTDGSDTVVNNGLLRGATGISAALGGGSDFFDGRLGVQTGLIRGMTGDDVLFGGSGRDFLGGDEGGDQLMGGPDSDSLDGGNGFDYARYDLAAGAVTVCLPDGSVNAGEAVGDGLSLIEGLWGSNFDDTLIGDGLGNAILGFAGNDAIAGGAGVDILSGNLGADVIFGGADGDLITGGAGADILKGEGGADLFVFGLFDQGDLIIGFNEGGVRDGLDFRSLFDATGYTGGDPRADGVFSVFQNRADTDVYVYGVFFARVENVVAAALDDTYFLFQ